MRRDSGVMEQQLPMAAKRRRQAVLDNLAPAACTVDMWLTRVEKAANDIHKQTGGNTGVWH